MVFRDNLLGSDGGTFRNLPQKQIMEARRNLIFFLMLFFLLQGCAARQEQNPELPAGAVKVTVVDYRDLDGCTFLLETDDKQKLQPVNLPAGLQRNGLRLYVVYKKTDGMSICMAGTMVNLSFTREIKDP